MVSSINKYKEYKKALIYIKELTKIHNLLSITIKEFEKHKKYLPIQECLHTLTTNQKLIEIHLMKQKNIVKAKGKE